MAAALWLLVHGSHDRAAAADPSAEPGAGLAAARSELRDAFEAVKEDWYRRQSAGRLKPLDPQDEAHVLVAVATVQRRAADAVTRRAAVSQIMHDVELLDYAALVDVPVERAIGGMYLTLLETSPRGNGEDRKLSVWAAKHVAATGDRAQFDRVLGLAVRLVTASAGPDGAIPEATPARFGAASTLNQIAAIAWTCNWDEEGEAAALAAGHVTEKTKLELLVASSLVQVRLETGVARSGSAVDALTAALPGIPTELLEASATDLPPLEKTLRLVASLAFSQGYRGEAERLLIGLRAIPWQTPAGAPAASAALRLGHDASLAACGIGPKPRVDTSATLADGDPGDTLVADLARAAAFRSRAIGLLRTGEVQAALAPISSAIALARAVGWHDLPGDDQRKRSDVTIGDHAWDIDKHIVGMDQLLRLRFYIAALAKDPEAVAFGLEWFGTLFESDRRDAVFHAVQFLGTVGDVEAADKLIDAALPILDDRPYPSPAELEGHHPVRDRLDQHLDLAFLRTDFLLRGGRVEDAVDNLAHVAPDGLLYEDPDQANRRRTLWAVSVRLFNNLNAINIAGVPPEILAVLPADLSPFPDYGFQAGAADAVALMGRVFRQTDGVAIAPETRGHAEEIFFRVMQHAMRNPLDVAMRMNLAQNAGKSDSRTDMLFRLRTMSDGFNLFGARLVHDAAAGARYSPIVDAYDVADELRLLDPPCPEAASIGRVPASTTMSGFMLRRAWDEYEDFMLRLSNETNQVAADDPSNAFGSKTSASAHIASLLRPGEVVIVAARAGPELTVATVTPAGLAIRLPTPFAAAERDVREVRASLVKAYDGRPPPFAHEAARRLSASLLAGLPNGRQRIFLVLDDRLRDLPENVLLTSDWDDQRRMGEQDWIDRRATTERLFGLDTLELRYWKSKETQGPPRTPFTVAVGSPILNGLTDCGWPSDHLQARSDAQKVAGRVSRLCMLTQAAEMLSLLAPDADPASRRLVGPAATLGQFRALAGSSDGQTATTLIFATHGLTADEAQDLSGVAEPALVLTPSVPDADDGLLRASEIAGMRLSADLVILIACNSGTRTAADATSYRGLVDAFLTAGAGSLMTTGWSADEYATAQLLAVYNSERVVGGTPEEILGRAMNDFRISRLRYEHPFYWAQFSFTGRIASP